MELDGPSVQERLADLKIQSFLDNISLHVKPRWALSLALFLLFWYRVFTLKAFYVIAYGLSIYLLNLFLLFLSPQFDPEDNDGYEDGPILPTTNDDEYRPFIRRLPEFKFWTRSFLATVASIFGTFFNIFNIEVFWPILVIYFFFLTYITLKKQIDHMIKFRYVPFEWGKKSYAPK